VRCSLFGIRCVRAEGEARVGMAEITPARP